MEIRPSDIIPGVEHLALDVLEDHRGFFVETYRAVWLAGRFVQSNLSLTRAGSLRGLHYHLAQDDLWTVLDGDGTAALVDLRGSSPAYLAIERVGLRRGVAVFIPAGVAHGFEAHRDLLLAYQVSTYYDGTDELGVAWDDPDLAVPWRVEAPILSDRDRVNPRWSEVPVHLRPGRRA